MYLITIEYCHSLEMHVLQRSYYITKTPLYGPHFYVIAALKNLRLKHALNSNNVLVLLFRQSELIPHKTFIHSVAAMTYTHPHNKLFQRYLFSSCLFCFVFYLFLYLSIMLQSQYPNGLLWW